MIPTTSDAFQWHRWGERKPPEGRLVLVWRVLRKKYSIARYEVKTPNPDDELDIHTDYWITEQSCMHPCQEEDVWYPFLHYKREEVYK